MAGPTVRRASNQLRDAPNRRSAGRPVGLLSDVMAPYKRVLCGCGQIEHPLEQCNYRGSGRVAGRPAPVED